MRDLHACARGFDQQPVHDQVGASADQRADAAERRGICHRQIQLGRADSRPLADVFHANVTAVSGRMNPSMTLRIGLEKRLPERYSRQMMLRR